MKKLVLILVCTVLLTFFIAFNYLLWDREKNAESIQTLESSNEDKNATIGALGREIKNLEDFNKQLSTRLQLAEETIENLEEEKSGLEKKLYGIEGQLRQKNDTIDALMQHADLKPLQDIVAKWVKSIDEGQYEEAYKLMTPQAITHDSSMGLNDFTVYFKESIKSMKLESIKLNTDQTAPDRKGDIIFAAELDVDRLKNTSEVYFDQGINKRYFTLAYNSDYKSWIILYIDAEL